MKTWMILVALILAPMTASAYPWTPDAANENTRGRILQQMAVYQEASLETIKAAVKAAKTETELIKARTDFEQWKVAGMQKRFADSSRGRMKSYFESQTALIGALRTPTASSGWSYFDGAKASSQEVGADAPVASVRYNYAKVRGIAVSQDAKALIVNAAIEEAMLQGVDLNLVLAIIQKESGYKSGAVSSAGAIGLMQLMPSTACDMGVCDANSLFDVRTNIRAGIKYLRWMTSFLKLDINLKDVTKIPSNALRYLLAANNAGIGNVQKWRKREGQNFRILFAETRNYVSEILGVLGAVGW